MLRPACNYPEPPDTSKAPFRQALQRPAAGLPGAAISFIRQSQPSPLLCSSDQRGCFIMSCKLLQATWHGLKVCCVRRAPRGCPCTPQLLCSTDQRGIFNEFCDIPRAPVATYSMHGGAGGIMSVGLLRAVSLNYMDMCIKSLYSTGDHTSFFLQAGHAAALSFVADESRWWPAMVPLQHARGRWRHQPELHGHMHQEPVLHRCATL